MITFADPALAKKARTLRLHGIDRDVFSRYHVANASWRYEIVAPGFKANLTDIAAAMGIVQLKRAWSFQKRRAELWQRYDEALGEAAHSPAAESAGRRNSRLSPLCHPPAGRRSDRTRRIHRPHGQQPG